MDPYKGILIALSNYILSDPYKEIIVVLLENFVG